MFDVVRSSSGKNLYLVHNGYFYSKFGLKGCNKEYTVRIKLDTMREMTVTYGGFELASC